MSENQLQYISQPVEITPTEMLAQSSDERACVDTQVVTAKRYPRNLTRAINNSIVMATMDVETAQKMRYALLRGNKPITGPSVHLAKLIASQYGNMRIEAKVVDITEREVVSRGIAWDLESNIAYSIDVRRSIINGKGQRYNNDMIVVTGNATNAIALRNAVFAAVPAAIIDKVYKAAQECITGDLSDETKLLKRREGAIKHFSEQYGITEDEVVALCGKHTVNQIGKNEIALLLGMAQSLKDGDTTVEDLMSGIRGKSEPQNDKMTEMARKRAASSRKSASAIKVDTETGEVINDVPQENTEDNDKQ